MRHMTPSVSFSPRKRPKLRKAAHSRVQSRWNIYIYILLQVSGTSQLQPSMTTYMYHKAVSYMYHQGVFMISQISGTVAPNVRILNAFLTWSASLGKKRTQILLWMLGLYYLEGETSLTLFNWLSFPYPGVKSSCNALLIWKISQFSPLDFPPSLLASVLPPGIPWSSPVKHGKVSRVNLPRCRFKRWEIMHQSHQNGWQKDCQLYLILQQNNVIYDMRDYEDKPTFQSGWITTLHQVNKSTVLHNEKVLTRWFKRVAGIGCYNCNYM